MYQSTYFVPSRFCSTLVQIDFGLFLKETDGKVWSKINLDRTPLDSAGKEEKVENLVADANHILESGCDEQLVENCFR